MPRDFGLFGHLVRMMRQHQLSAKVFADALPVFDGVLDLLRNDVIPGAVQRNREFVGDDLETAPGVDEACINLDFDAQTSGEALNEKVKELILFSLVVQSRCHPCFDAHYQRARELGITQAELDEAAWCAIALGVRR